MSELIYQSTHTGAAIDAAVTKVPTLEAQINTLDAEIHGVPAVKIEHSVAQSIPNGAPTVLVFDTVKYDTDEMYNMSNNNKLTCKTSGKYLIIVQVGFSGNATGTRSIRIRVNGTEVANCWSNSAGSDYAILIASTIIDLSENNSVDVVAYQTSGVALDVIKRLQASPEFMMVKVG